MAQTGSPMEQKQRWYARWALPRPVTKFFARGWDFITRPHQQVRDVATRRQARLLAALSFLMMVLSSLGMLGSSMANHSSDDLQKNMILLTTLTVSSLIAYGLSRTPYYKVGIAIMMLAISLLSYMGAAIGDPDALTFALIILPLAFFLGIALITVRGIVILSIGNILLAMLLPKVFPNIDYGFAGTIAGQALVYGALLGIVISTRQGIEHDRINEVHTANEELHALTANMEERITERTREMALAVEVGRRIAVVRDLNDMLCEAVELVRQHFNLYYTQVYLLDATGRTLILRAGTGDIGRELLHRSHRLMVDLSSANGTAVVERRPIVVSDTASSGNFLSHPLLPETRSEIAIPLIVGDRMLGVLDLQSQVPGGLTLDNLPVFEVLAGQLATALLNTELFEQLQRSLEELEIRSRQSTEQGWASYMDAVEVSERIGYTFDHLGVSPLQEPLPAVNDPCVLNAPIEVSGLQVGAFQFAGEQSWSRDDVEMVNQVVSQVAQQVENLRLLNQANRYQRDAQEALRRLTREEWDGYLADSKDEALVFAYQNGRVDPVPADQNGHGTMRRFNINVQDEPIGELELPVSRALTPEDEDLIALVNEQLGAHLENMRLYSTAQVELQERKRAEERIARRAAELAMVADTATVVATIASAEEMLQTVVDLVKHNFGLYHAHVYMLNEAGDTLTLAKGAGAVGRQMEAEGRSIRLDAERSLVARAARERAGIIVNNVRLDPEFLPHPLLPDTRSEMAVPMIAGDRLLGVLDIQDEELDRFTDEDIAIQTTLASQVAIALQNARQYEQTQASEKLVRTVIDSTPDWIFIKDQQHRYRLVNQGYANSLHLKVEDFMGKNDIELGFPEELVKGNPEKGITGFWPADREVMDSGESKIIDFDPVMIDGKQRILNTMKTPLRDAAGNVWGVLAFGRDVTERETLLSQTARLYDASRRLGEAQSLNDILQAVVETVNSAAVNRGVLYFFEKDASGALENVTIAANWYSGEGTPPDAVGERIPEIAVKQIFSHMQVREPLFHDRTSELAHSEDIFSAIAMPLWIGDRQLGVVALQTLGQHTFTDDEKRLVAPLAQQVALALESRLLLEETIASEASLRTISDQLAEALKAARMANWEFDLATGEFIFNDTFYAFLKTTAEAEGGYRMPADVFARKFVHPDDAVGVGANVGEALATDDPNYLSETNARQILATGEVRDVVIRFRIKKDEQGRTVQLFGANQDVTEQRRIADQIESQRRTLQAVLDNMPAGVFMIEAPSGKPVLANKRAEEFLGRGISPNVPAELAKEVFPAYITGTEEMYPMERMPSIKGMAGETSMIDDMEIPRPDGSRMLVQVNGAPVFDAAGKLVASVVVIQDITERKRAAMALEEQQILLQQELVERQRMEEALSGALRAARMGYWELDLSTMIFTFNDEFYAMLRTTAEAEGGYQMHVEQYAKKFAHPEDVHLVADETMKAIQTTDPNYTSHVTHRFYYADGEMGYLNVTITVVKDENGQTIKTRGANQDVSEVRRAALALEEQQRTLQTILDNMPVAVLAKDAKNYQFVMWNKMAESLFGIPNESVIGKTDFDFYPQEQAEAFRAADMEVLEKRVLVDIPEEKAETSEGTRILHTVKVPVVNEENQPILLLVVTEDITERKKSQEIIAKRAVELATVAEVATRVSTIQTPDEMLQTVVDLTKQAFDLYHAHIYLFNDAGDTLVLAKGAGDVGRKMVAEGRQIVLNAEKSLVARAARLRHGVIVNNVRQDPEFLAHPLLPDTRSEMAVPMIAGDRLVGVIDIQDEEVDRFTAEDVNIMNTLAAQVAVSLQNARSYARAQRQAEREALINAISERIQATNSVETALQVAVREIGRALGAPHTAIRLGLERKNNDQ